MRIPKKILWLIIAIAVIGVLAVTFVMREGTQADPTVADDVPAVEETIPEETSNAEEQPSTPEESPAEEQTQDNS